MNERKFTQEETRTQFVDKVEEQYGLLDMILGELKLYMAEIKAYVKEKNVKSETIRVKDVVIRDYHPHHE